MVFLPDDQLAVEPAFLATMLAEIDGICAEIPHDELAIQWDVSPEFIVLEGAWRTQLAGIPGGVASRLAELGNYVPAEVALGYHLCYGDPGHKHAVEPRDTGNLVDIANRVAVVLTRPLNWCTSRCRVTVTTRGTSSRCRTCGWRRTPVSTSGWCTRRTGRRPPAVIPALLDLHRAVIDGSLPCARQSFSGGPRWPGIHRRVRLADRSGQRLRQGQRRYGRPADPRQGAFSWRCRNFGVSCGC
jgi:hypothetical protein